MSESVYSHNLLMWNLLHCLLKIAFLCLFSHRDIFFEMSFWNTKGRKVVYNAIELIWPFCQGPQDISLISKACFLLTLTWKDQKNQSEHREMESESHQMSALCHLLNPSEINARGKKKKTIISYHHLLFVFVFFRLHADIFIEHWRFLSFVLLLPISLSVISDLVDWEFTCLCTKPTCVRLFMFTRTFMNHDTVTYFNISK